jgi:hypothetical protein
MPSIDIRIIIKRISEHKFVSAWGGFLLLNIGSNGEVLLIR